MLRLTLLRHAHAADAVPGQLDFERPLTPAGEARARGAGDELRARGVLPTLAYSSPALRTRQTAELALPAIAVVYGPALYLGAVPALLNALAVARGSPPHLLLVGHNPGISELQVRLAGRQDFNGFAPGDWASLWLPIERWRDIGSIDTPARRA